MKWALILIIFGGSSEKPPFMISQQFDHRELCVNAKNYYESENFKRRMNSFIVLDAQCHQLDYIKK
jgi:hypothetical protein